MRSLGLCRNVAPKEFSDIGHEINLEDTFMCQLDDDSIVGLGKVNLCEVSDNASPRLKHSDLLSNYLI